MSAKHTRWPHAVALLAMLGAQPVAMAYEEAFQRTPVDEIQVRTLPPARWLATDAPGRYFEQSNALFGRLFSYIKANDISMTVPVEGALERAEMRFYVGDDAAQGLPDSDAVRVVDTPRRQVVSLGGRGAYSEENVQEVRERVQAWVQNRPEWRTSGDAYAVFWNGPFTPWFMKRFEVHVPVAAIDTP